MRIPAAMEPQWLSLSGVNSPIALRAHGEGRDPTSIRVPGPRGLPYAASPIEASAFLTITFLCIPLNCHRGFSPQNPPIYCDRFNS